MRTPDARPVDEIHECPQPGFWILGLRCGHDVTLQQESPPRRGYFRCSECAERARIQEAARLKGEP
jgi:hypothetical protein